MSDLHIARITASVPVDVGAAYETADALLLKHARPHVPIDVRALARAVGCTIEEVSPSEWRDAPGFLRDLPAYYESERRTIWVRSEVSKSRVETGIAHELGHDQIPSQARVLRESGISRSRISAELWNLMEAQARLFSFYLRLGGHWFEAAVKQERWGLLCPIEQSRMYGVSAIMALQRFVEISDRPCVLRVFELVLSDAGQRVLKFRRFITSAHDVRWPHAAAIHGAWPSNHPITSLALLEASAPQRCADGRAQHEVWGVDGRVYALTW